MFHTLLGPTVFRKAMDFYFSHNDGYPVTVEEFVKAMETGSGRDFTQFRRWYKQAGTPLLRVTDSYDPGKKIYSLTVAQSCPATPDQPHKELFHIPLVIGLLGDQGQELPLVLADDTTAQPQTSRVLDITQATQTFNFINIASKPLPSLLRDFSAPVKLEYNYTEKDLSFLLSHDVDDFNRWDAAQQLALQIMRHLIKAYQSQRELTVPMDFIQALSKVFNDKELDPLLAAEILTLPAESYVLEQMQVADVDAVHFVREWLRKQIAQSLRQDFLNFLNQHKGVTPYSLDLHNIALRKMKNMALSYLVLLEEKEFYQLCLDQFHQANNMTDTMGAMMAINNLDCEQRKTLVAEYFLRWSNDALVVDKWFSLQAQSFLPNTLEVVKSLTQHPLFDLKNPNRVRSLIGVFSMHNLLRFHVTTGEGYRFLADYVVKINSINPQLAARLADPLIHWHKFDANRQALMKGQLERIASTANLSKDVYEVVSKGLA